MKKFIKNLTRSLCLLFIVSFATLSFVGCGNKDNQNSNPASNTANTTIGGEINNSADNVNQGDETETVVELNGIYKFAREITYKDTFWTVSDAEVFEYFETTDVNGVYNALKNINFLEDVNEKTLELAGTTYELMFGFIDDQCITFLHDGYDYKILKTSEISSLSIEIEVIDENSIVVKTQYTYTDENNQEITTPVFIKVPLTKIANSENILTGTTYTYVAGSSKIELSNQSTMTEEEAMIAVAEIFDIPTTDIAATIEEMFANYDIQIDENLTKVTVFDKYYGTISFAPITNATGSVYGITISTTGRTVDVVTGIETINLVVSINENAIFTFEYKAV